MAPGLVGKMRLHAEPLPISAKRAPVFHALGDVFRIAFAERPGRARRLFFGRSLRCALISCISYSN
jgi:hypothetical protein